MEQNSHLTKMEFDKYKLLVSESDVINNLLIKLSNKLATIDNSIQIIELIREKNMENNMTNLNEFVAKQPEVQVNSSKEIVSKIIAFYF